MTKKKQKSNTTGKPRSAANQARKIQREWLEVLRDEVDYLSEIGLLAMTEQGVLPPLYGGDFLEDDVEVIPLWGLMEGDQEELGIVLLRSQPGVEPDPLLEEARDEIDMVNDLPIMEMLPMLGSEDHPMPIEGGERLKDLMIALALFGPQVQPASGYDHDKMIEYMGQEMPFALFVHVPVARNDEDLTYEWDDLENFRAEVVYADTPEDLQMAVWKYRLELALKDEISMWSEEGGDPQEEMLAQNVEELTAMFDIMVMEAMRYYGTTSPVRAKQEQLDVLRDDEGILEIRTPLNPAVEPVPMLAQMRADFSVDNPGAVLRLDSEGEVLAQVWPKVRSHPYFCMRMRRAELSLDKRGRPQISGFLQVPVVEWILADTLPDLYRKVTFHCLREILLATGLLQVMPVIEEAEPEDADEPETHDP